MGPWPVGMTATSVFGIQHSVTSRLPRARGDPAGHMVTCCGTKDRGGKVARLWARPGSRDNLEADEGKHTMNNARNTRPGAGGRLAELTAYDCWGLLESEEIARVAWHGRDGVAIVPVNYTVADGSLWFRTSPSSTLGRECAGQTLAIEIDHIDRTTRSAWSVVVSGVVELVDAAEVPDVLAGLRVWPSGSRPLFIRVEPAHVTGRKLLASAAVG